MSIEKCLLNIPCNKFRRWRNGVLYRPPQHHTPQNLPAPTKLNTTKCFIFGGKFSWLYSFLKFSRTTSYRNKVLHDIQF